MPVFVSLRRGKPATARQERFNREKFKENEDLDERLKEVVSGF